MHATESARRLSKSLREPWIAELEIQEKSHFTSCTGIRAQKTLCSVNGTVTGLVGPTISTRSSQVWVSEIKSRTEDLPIASKLLCTTMRTLIRESTEAYCVFLQLRPGIAKRISVRLGTLWATAV